MLGLLIIILSICIAYAMMKDNRGFDFTDLLLSIITGGLSGVLIVMICILCAIPFSKTSDFKPDGSINIISVQTKDSISGNFHLGTGYIGNTRYYIALKDLGNDRYKSIQIQESEVDYIEENNSINPCVNIFKQETTNTIIKLLCCMNIRDPNYRYIIVVPKNTVMVKYQVN